jgi:hypothetical protein
VLDRYRRLRTLSTKRIFPNAMRAIYISSYQRGGLGLRPEATVLGARPGGLDATAKRERNKTNIIGRYSANRPSR